nr:MAG TPA: Protein of unknown function (DUF551) [Caudoviricetes sp.]
MRDEFSGSVTKTVVDFATQVRETEDKFIFETIAPFCRNTLKRTISKKELEEILLRAERMKWIPCSERLPKKPERGENGYIVQKKHVAEPFSAYWDGERWTNEDDDVIDEVMAWLPLPEPYKGE